jgi:hypothetical protein
MLVLCFPKSDVCYANLSSSLHCWRAHYHSNQYTTMPWEAPRARPAIAPGVVWPRCDERAVFNDYQNPCSSIQNPVPRPAHRGPQHCAPQVCGFLPTANGPNGPTHGPNGYTVCLYCRACTRNKKWYKDTENTITAVPPNLEPHSSRGFQTRMCRLCKERERLLQYRRNKRCGVFNGVPNALVLHLSRRNRHHYP